MILKVRHIIPTAVAALLALTLLPGCFTGVESTKKITADKESRRKTPQLTPEEKILADIGPEAPADWKAGKEFLVCEGRLDYAFTPAAEAGKLSPGDTLRFLEFIATTRLAGDSVTDLTFTAPDGAILTHRVELAPSRLTEVGELAIPFTVELSQVDNARRVLKDRTVWTRRPDASGRKFQRTKILDVLPGTPELPLLVELENDRVYIVVEGKTVTARTFGNLFSLSDPRESYPQISDEVWDKISQGKIAAEMTRDECRLALGDPMEVTRDATYGGIVERWTYENGVYLVFVDGRLTEFRL